MSAALFASAARAFAALVHDIPATKWDGPGLGEWDLRSLVGHTSRSLITVSAYLQTTAEREDLAGAVEYYVYARDFASNAGTEAIVERGRQAGRDLGEDPAAAVDHLLAGALDDLSGAGDPLITVIGGVGMRLSGYLPTRTFELAVHGFDIARVTGLTFAPPEDVLADAAALAARIGVAFGQGETVLSALTGRAALPEAFSVV
ncbi:maleylpyruvate isomerase family mycothiol-dependent enzyme [Mycobacterium sp. URHB0044]|uniref:maleylpyruvate isomerase family mycothiol-dependent enzyme n=1 Tax=Mycobacterium sp. URHB0044 TaxID=1380386 RepID=UPI00048CBE2A|nr:maleylpyruvate isomerase family mycothiol-dependent enzyme [Mycobacterium sp. URHB0044]